MNYFESSTEEEFTRYNNLKIELGMLARLSGCRPSALFHWNEEEDWLDRLLFDLEVSNITWQNIYKRQGN